jgi:hypothetical protein
MHAPPPLPEHQWLQKLVGEWRFESECHPGSDQPPMKSSGTESVRSLGGLWTIGEGRGEMPSGGTCTTLMTLGYDPQIKRFVGTFVASVMTHLWPYDGSLDETGQLLTLNSEGPSFADETKYAKYQDMIRFIDDNHRILSSQYRDEDGEWHLFMTAHYYRVEPTNL